MARFRKKPVEVEAWQWQAQPVIERPEWVRAAGCYLTFDGMLVVPTLEGDHLASPGDWIIQGVKGEVYPCKPDIFAMTYDEAG
jgi:hypothetical protein